MTPMHCIQIKTQQDALTGQCVPLTAIATRARARAHAHTHTRIQSAPPPFTFRKLRQRFKGLVHAVRSIVQAEGVRQGLYAGVLLPRPGCASPRPALGVPQP